MKFDTPVRIIAVATFCALALIGLVVREGAARASGTEAILHIEAVDPRSLLHGHYVVLALQETATSCPPGADDVAGGNTTRSNWVAFRQNADHHSVAGVAKSQEMAAKLGPIVARGSAWCGTNAASRTIRTDVGIDRFHISQAEAQRIERILREQRVSEARVSAIVSIGRDGRARLKGLIVDNQRIELRWL
jgi:uncharacterized membrane-anchored protein